MSTCARNGINFNKKKFRFAEETADYVGFILTQDEIKPAESITETILNFPAPKNITLAEAFFGLVE